MIRTVISKITIFNFPILTIIWFFQLVIVVFCSILIIPVLIVIAALLSFVITINFINDRIFISDDFNLIKILLIRIKKHKWLRDRIKNLGLSKDIFRKVLVSSVTIAIALYLAVNRSEILSSTKKLFLGNFR